MDGTSDTVDTKTCFEPLRRAGAIPLVLAIAGCAIAPFDSEVDYPPSFPKLAQPVGLCPAVGASISTRGERYTPVSGLVDAAMLDRDVLGLPDLFAGADVLRLTFDEAAVPGLFGPMKVNILHIVANSGENWRTSPERSSCRGGVFQYVAKDAGGFHPLGLAVSSYTIKFAGAVDGSLIVRQGHQDSGVLFVAPYKFTSGTIYYRFPVLTGPATRLP